MTQQGVGQGGSNIQANAKVDVAEAAELTGLSASAIRGRIRRQALAHEKRDGRYRIAVTELHRSGLTVPGVQYRRLTRRAEELEAELREARAERDRVKSELEDSIRRVRMLWAALQDPRKEPREELARRRRRRIRWPWRASP
jgi:hypothetical protein